MSIKEYICVINNNSPNNEYERNILNNMNNSNNNEQERT